MKISIQNKKMIYENVLNQLNSKIDLINSKMIQIQKSLTSETKSTAGDKHETGRAMLHLEQEKNHTQLQNLLKQLKVLDSINPDKKSKQIELGTLIHTSKGYFYISISGEAINTKKITIFILSAVSPIGKLLLTKENGDQISFNNNKFKIIEYI